MENLTNIITPADEIASTTPVTEPSGESVTNQAPTVDTTPDTPTAVTKRPYVVEKTWPGLECSKLKEPDDPAELSAFTATETTGEPLTNQAPDAQTDNTTTPAALPADYLANGYYATTDKGATYLRPEFVGKYAEIMASLLADMKPSDFNGLLREMKRSKKTTLPFEARMTAALELVPKALALVNRKKAPALLVSFIKDNLDHIQNDDDWTAFYRHLSAIAAYMTAQKGGDT